MKSIIVSIFKADTGFEGKNFEEILELKNQIPSMENAAALVIDLFMDGGAYCVYHCLSEDDVNRVIKHPYVMIGSDATNVSFGTGTVHPRNYSNFPRVIAYYVKEKGSLELEEAIRKMTSLPASRINAMGRGIIKEGNFADLVIFDYNTIQDKATFSNPHRYPEGIDYVIVNGEFVVYSGNITGKLPGEIIYGAGRKELDD